MNTEPSAVVQPIIIKRKKVYKSDEHHGGAWKIAYADFVTAMMAFFLLMWLLNATTEEQRKGLADYFSPTIPISRISGGGSDGLNGSSVFTEETYAKMGTGGTRKKSVDSPTSRGETEQEKDAKLIVENLHNFKQELSETARELSDHLLIKMSPEGIVLEIIDSDNMPLFQVGRSEPTPLLADLLSLVSDSFNSFENDIKIVGHTDNLGYRDNATYDNWNLSTDRANTARKLFIENGMASARIREVSGKADTDLLILDNPSAAQNRRIAITILTE